MEASVNLVTYQLLPEKLEASPNKGGEQSHGRHGTDNNGCIAHARLPASFAEHLQQLPIADGIGACGTAAARKNRYWLRTCMLIHDLVDYLPLAKAYRLRACWSHPFTNQDGAVAGTFAV